MAAACACAHVPDAPARSPAARIPPSAALAPFTVPAAPPAWQAPSHGGAPWQAPVEAQARSGPPSAAVPTPPEPAPGLALPDAPEVEPPPAVPGLTPERARSDEMQAIAGARFVVLSGVTLSAAVRKKIARVADAYFRRTGRELIVTSGTRDAARQADAMHELFRLGADVMSLYKNKSAAREIQQAYVQGRSAGRSRGAVVARMADVIRRQIARGVFISAHLRAGAVDIRSRDMTGAQKRAFLDAVDDIGGVTAMEESRPPHYHLQVD